MFLRHSEQSIKDTFKTTEPWLHPSFLSGNTQPNDRRTGERCESHFMNFWINTFLRIEAFSELQAKQKARRHFQNNDLKVIRAKKHQLYVAWVLSLPASGLKNPGTTGPSAHPLHTPTFVP